VLENATDEKRKREELKTKRDLLFERYLKHPMDTRLALEIKTIDDQLAEPAKQMKRKTGSSN
jgi:DNA-directed RNA polymerase subunit L